MQGFEIWNMEVSEAEDETLIEVYSLLMPGVSDEYVVGLNTVIDAINQASGDIRVRINSKGGEVGTAVTLYNRLREYDKGKVTTVVDGHAYSAGGLLAQAGDERIIKNTSTFMCHNAMMFTMINGPQSLKKAENAWKAHQDQVIGIFTDRTAINREELVSLMDEETFLNAEDATAKGFFDRVESGSPQPKKEGKAKSAPKKSLRKLQRIRANM